MRFTRRQDPSEAVAADGVPATYARLLDGDHLWLALPVGQGSAVLRDLTTGRVLSPVDQLARSEPGWLSLRWLLVDGSLPGDSEGEYAVEWRTESGATRPVLAPAPRKSPTKAPPSPDGRWQFSTRSDETGRLLLCRERAPRRAPLSAIDADHDGLVIACRASKADQRLALLDGDRLVTSLTTSYASGDARAVVRAADVTAATVQVALVDAEGPTPVGRRHNELRNPGAVLLPVWSDSSSAVELRARFAGDATLWLDRVEETGASS